MNQSSTTFERDQLADLFGFDPTAREAARARLSQLPRVSRETVTSLRGGLESKHLDHALVCARLLDSLGLEVEAANEAVIRLLFQGDGRPSCRCAVFRTVEGLADRRHLQAAVFARCFAESDNRRRALGINAVSELAQAVVHAFEIASPIFKRAVVECIGDTSAEIRDEVADSLTMIIKRTPSAGADAWIINEHTYVDALRSYLYHLDMGVQLCAARVLTHLMVDEPLIVDVALTCLAASDADVRVRAAHVLRCLPYPEALAAERLLGILRDQGEWDAPTQGILSDRICSTDVFLGELLEVAAAAFRVHGTVDADLTAFVVQQCRRGDAAARKLATTVLQALGLISWHVARPLRDILSQASAPLVEQGFQIVDHLLREEGTPGTSATLAHTLCNREDARMRQLGLGILQHLAAPELVSGDMLVRLLSDPDQHVRQQACHTASGLGIREPGVLEQLNFLLSDPQRWVADAARRALRHLGCGTEQPFSQA